MCRPFFIDISHEVVWGHYFVSVCDVWCHEMPQLVALRSATNSATPNTESCATRSATPNAELCDEECDERQWCNVGRTMR